MKLKVSSSLICLLFASTAFAETTASQKIEKINIQSMATTAHYYFYNQIARWGAASCKDARYAYISETTPGAKEILSLALAAKATGTAVQFKGDCEGTDYFKINYMILQ